MKVAKGKEYSSNSDERETYLPKRFLQEDKFENQVK